jgi:hypothetical protein
MFSPNIALLGRHELQSLGWKNGYSVSWRAPEGLDLKYLLRYDVIDSGLSGNNSMVYTRQANVLSIQHAMGKIRVRAVTIDGIGQYSDGVDTAALKPKSDRHSGCVGRGLGCTSDCCACDKILSPEQAISRETG